MEQYIPKDIVAAKIEKIKSHIGSDKYLSDYEKGCNFGREDVCDSLLNFIDTLEVKEVDLEQISKHYALNNSPWDDCWPEVQDAFKAGFELGLKAQKGE